ncbi:glycosyltransferase 61 family protein [Rubritepida flocculans]|jgi:hypothetical protein|uniref:glycosyltransferase 61 family protein n=1 Tax=Rubritepida flocculans TaxID=182403 RepID=UPI00041A2A0D|nr:glycosyltransferase family 61 protein [Rubritepida flocculans]
MDETARSTMTAAGKAARPASRPAAAAAAQARQVGPFAERVTVFEGIGVTRNLPDAVGRRQLPLRPGLCFPPDAPPWVYDCTGGRATNMGVPAPSVPSDAPLIPGTFVYGGPVWHSFGHFISEFVHRLWVTELPEWRDAPVAFIATEGRSPPGFLGQIMALMGVRDWRVLEGPARIERLVVAEQGKMLHCPPAPAYVAFLRRRLAQLLDAPPRFPRRLAVLRGHLGAGHGRCVGENWLLRQLTQLGYAEFRPETVPIADQANAYVHAEKIVFSEGSAIHLFDILPPVRAEIAVLNRRPGSHLGRDSLGSKAARLHVFDDIRLLGDPRGGLTTSLGLFDPRKVLGFLQETGMIASLPDADLLDEAPELAEDVAAFVRARHPVAAVRSTKDDERLLAETVAYLARMALRGAANAAPTDVAPPPPRRRGTGA